MNYNSLSPLDSRYSKYVEELTEYFSEEALYRYRVYIELKYLEHFFKTIQINDNADNMKKCLKYIMENLDVARIKELERDTKHDVKAIEYYIREQLKKLDLSVYIPYIHFGLTSEDVTSPAYSLITKRSINNVMKPELNTLMNIILRLANDWRNIAILGHTHGISIFYIDLLIIIMYFF